MANRAAAVLGLLGRPGDAAALYRPRNDAAVRYSDAVRLADWAIGQGSPDAAASSAWRAVEAAATTEDRLYALALVVESYRTADQLAGAEAFLAHKPRGPEVDQARLDVLLELRRYDDAVAMVQQAGDAALRERLLGVLRAAGRTTEVEAEYRRLIRVQPPIRAGPMVWRPSVSSRAGRMRRWRSIAAWPSPTAPGRTCRSRRRAR